MSEVVVEDDWICPRWCEVPRSDHTDDCRRSYWVLVQEGDAETGGDSDYRYGGEPAYPRTLEPVVTDDIELVVTHDFESSADVVALHLWQSFEGVDEASAVLETDLQGLKRLHVSLGEAINSLEG